MTYLLQSAKGSVVVHEASTQWVDLFVTVSYVQCHCSWSIHPVSWSICYSQLWAVSFMKHPSSELTYLLQSVMGSVIVHEASIQWVDLFVTVRYGQCCSWSIHPVSWPICHNQLWAVFLVMKHPANQLPYMLESAVCVAVYISCSLEYKILLIHR